MSTSRVYRPDRMIRIAVVDDHPHVAIALRALLDKTPDIRLAAESRRGGDVAAVVSQR
jgi:DNA-binding NarL/FixJ family response regulator